MNYPISVIQINRYGMGEAPPELSHKLMRTYLQMLVEGEDRPLPGAICLYAEGVKLATSGSPVLEQLRALSVKGVQIIICSTCLAYFGLTDQIEVGIVGGMHDIIEAQHRADKVITL